MGQLDKSTIEVQRDLDEGLDNQPKINIVWDDLRAPAMGINPAGSPAPPTISTSNGSLIFATNNIIAIWFQLPHNWKEGSTISPHMHWYKSTSAAGVVNWQMKYTWTNIGEVFPSFSSLVSGTELIPNSDTANKHALLEFPEIVGTGKTLSSMLCIILQRTATGDTYGATANLLEFDIHYQIDGLGSRQEYIK